MVVTSCRRRSGGGEKPVNKKACSVYAQIVATAPAPTPTSAICLPETGVQAFSSRRTSRSTHTSEIHEQLQIEVLFFAHYATCPPEFHFVDAVRAAFFGNNFGQVPYFRICWMKSFCRGDFDVGKTNHPRPRLAQPLVPLETRRAKSRQTARRYAA